LANSYMILSILRTSCCSTCI